MPANPVLHVCHVDEAGPKIHACRRAHDALDAAGVAHDKVVSGRNRPLGLFTGGRRPELKKLSGQEKLPVLELPDGSTVNGSAAIIDWAKAHAAAG
jgi:glutathione S-transferase